MIALPELQGDGPAVSSLHVLLALTGMLVTAWGTLAASALLVYSPTKLARDESGRRLVEHLAIAEREYQVLARVLGISGVAATALLAWHAAPSQPGIAVAIALIFGVPIGGVLPARFAEANPERVLRFTIPVLHPLRSMLRWIVVLPTLLGVRPVLRILRVPEDDRVAEPNEIADDILAAVTDSAQESALPAEERRWIENIIELKDRQAGEVITPRTDMVSFPASLSLDEAVRRAIETGFSRYPIYRERIDDVVGVFYAKDALAMIGDSSGFAAKTVADMARKPLFVPESIGLVELLRQFRATKRQMAIVLDEYGGTAGLVTIEDVLEEIVGEIEDEYDPVIEQPIKVVEEGRVIEVSGRTRVDEANDHLADRIVEGDDYDTVAGWVFTSLDRIPATDEVCTIDSIEIRILEADDRRIARMRLTLPTPESTTEPAETPRDGARGER